MINSILLKLGIRKSQRPESRVILVNHTIFHGADYGVRRRRSSAAIRRESIQRRKSEVLQPGHEHSIPPEPSGYQYPKNEIITSRYTLLNFLPKNLFEQFQRIANFYFLLVAIIQLFIDSPVSPATSIAPLIFVISVTAIKQAYEDFLRHRADNEVNQKYFEVVKSTGEFSKVKAMDINVGDVVCCRTNDGFPCDMVLVASSEDSGQCYVTTASLDGETNLKVFSALPETKDYLTPLDILNELKAVIQCQEPVDDLYSFVGKMWIKRRSSGVTVCRPLSAENVLLRGAVLKNTDFVLGCAVYTGLDTKMALNSKGKRVKQSQVENRLNYFLIIYFCILLLVTGVSVIVKYIWKAVSPSIGGATYVPSVATSPWLIVQDIFGFIVLYNYLIPISLYVTIELQKFIGSNYIAGDPEMYDAKLDIPAKANTSDLNEELGQVQYLFSDKTGTLTENEMIFRQCSVRAKKYVDMDGSLCVEPPAKEEMPKMLSGEWRAGKTEDGLLEFFTVLALCHTVRIDSAHSEKPMKNASKLQVSTQLNEGFQNDINALPSGYEYVYQASSPDEKAFVEACRNYGIVYHGLENGNNYVLTFGQPVSTKKRGTSTTSDSREKRVYKVLQTLDFDSERKCMTVILRYPDNTIHVHCKGAETAMLSRNRKSEDSVHPDIIMKHVTDYASDGLRTLVIATKQITEQEYENMSRQLDAARGGLGDNREKDLKVAYGLFESNLRLLGCTGIEDRLQDGVPETIQQLRKAGIQVWILTGDKEETAINISYSAGHFSSETNEIRLTRKTTDQEVMRAILNALEAISQNPHDKHRANQAATRRSDGLVIDGATLKIAFKPKIRRRLIELCLQVDTVLCCRMTPLQKAEVVSLIKNNVKPEPVTAAIGDGANDVSMIQEAHVGLGIYGKEGRQAVRSSDYAFTRFRHARRILLVHGHYFYIRIALLIQYFFYKNMVFVASQFYYAIFNAFSAQSVYDSLYLMLYNLTFTSLPILIFGIVEQDLSQYLLYYKPEMYKCIRWNSLLTWAEFIKWNVLGVWHSLVVYFSVHLLLYDSNSSVLGSAGQSDTIQLMGTLILACVWIIVNARLLLISHYFNWLYFVAIILITLLLNAGALIMYSQIQIVDALGFNNYSLIGVWFNVFGCASSWLIIIFAIFCSLIPDVILRWWEDRQLMQVVGMSPHRWKHQHIHTIAKDEPAPKMSSVAPTTKIMCEGYPMARVYTDPTYSSSQADIPNGNLSAKAPSQHYRSRPSHEDVNGGVPNLAFVDGIHDAGAGRKNRAAVHSGQVLPEHRSVRV